MYPIETLVKFLNSQFFIALITLAVGVTAFILYIRQRRDHKSDAALLILQEIRYAEQVFRSATQGSRADFLVFEKMLPTNNWNQNIHLFLELEETELDLISRFYSKAAYIDHLVSKISDFKNKEVGLITQTPPQRIILDPNQHTNQNMNPQQVDVPFLYDPMGQTQELLRIVCADMEFVYNTPTGEKLKRLSSKRSLLYFF